MSRSGSQVDSLDQFFFCGIIERGADAALDIAERLVDYLQGVEPVPHRLPLQIHQHRVAQSRHQVTSFRYPSNVLLATCFSLAASHLVKKPLIVSREASGANFSARADLGKVTK